MKTVRVALLIVVGALVIVQFFQPDRNVSEGPQLNDITKHMLVPQAVQSILAKACFDCHSNNTRYPWYAGIQPVAWILQNHITHGKRNLNFNEFGSYTPRRQYRKLAQIADELSEETMPLASYKLMHADARLTEEERRTVTDWVEAARQTLRGVYPADSLEGQPRR